MTIDPLTDEGWPALLARSTGATVFHHPAWLRLVCGHYGYPLFAVTVEGAGLPLALVRSRLTGRRLVAIPFTDTCGPVVADDAPPGARERLAAEVEAVRAAHDVGLIVHEAFPELPGSVEGERYHQHVIDLRDGAQAAEQRFASRARRNTRKAIKLGLVYERRTDRAALDAFYALHLETRRRLGVPTQPKRFIRGIEGLFAEGLGFVGLVRRDGEPVAAAVFLGDRRRLVYKYGASDAAHLEARPNNLLFTEAIRAAADAGYAELDLGRTDIGHEGLREFKLGWGAEEREFAYTLAGGATEGSGRSEELLGGVIRRSPPWVGRAIGELLYRHAG